MNEVQAFRRWHSGKENGHRSGGRLPASFRLRDEAGAQAVAGVAARVEAGRGRGTFDAPEIVLCDHPLIGLREQSVDQKRSQKTHSVAGASTSARRHLPPLQ